ncbi:MAG: flagellar biosynthetic protein FliO [Agathobacter sp.]|nr:flagellar biosynthetic protein FliO [Agathobacter sp.]
MILSVSSSFMNSVIDLITVLVIFVFVLALTYYVTRWIAGYQRTKTAQGNLSVLEGIRVSNSQSIQIVRAGTDKYLVVGVSKDQMTLLATLTADELRATTLPMKQTSRPGERFSDILEEFKKKHAK